MAERNNQARCLLVLPAGHDAPLDLIDGLQRRGVSVREVHDAPGAMAAVAAGRPGRPTMLVLVEPDALRDATRLASTLHRYFPKLPLWRYAFGQDPPLAPWQHNGTPPESEPQGVSASADMQAPPDFEVDDTVLTEEELAMLLGDDDDLEPEKDDTV